jgi:NitT/TauT family transport system substrate-binding protein
MRFRGPLALAAAAAIASAACGPAPSGLFSSFGPAATSGSPGASPAGSPVGSPQPTLALTKVSLRVGPLTNAEFAGYVAAQVLGYYADEGLEVDIVNSDPASRSYVGTTGPEFTIADVADVLAARESGSDLVDIAQIFQRSGTGILTWKATGVGSACDLSGKRIGLWPAVAGLEVRSRMAACGLGSTGYTPVLQGHDVAGFLGRTVDAVEARGFDEYARVLEAIDPRTDAQYTPDDLAFFAADADATATLKDAIFARAGWLAQTGNRDIAVSFVRAAIRGWVYCRDHQEDCVQFVSRATPGLGTTHQRWMLNEVNGLIWPSPSGIGAVDQALWDQTISVALGGSVISARPAADAADATIVSAAVSVLSDLDLRAPNFQKGEVAVAPGGE